MDSDREELEKYVRGEDSEAVIAVDVDFRMPWDIWVLGYVFRIIGFKRGALRGAEPPVLKKRFLRF
jgi:hypothetical protein